MIIVALVLVRHIAALAVVQFAERKDNTSVFCSNVFFYSINAEWLHGLDKINKPRQKFCVPLARRYGGINNGFYKADQARMILYSDSRQIKELYF